MSDKKKNGFVEEFRQFIMRGNVVQMAIGIVVGAAFSAIVTAFVSGVINPVIGMLVGKVDFSELKIVIQQANLLTGKEEIAIMYGVVLQKIFEFVVIAFCMFLVIKGMNKLEEAKKAKEAKEAADAAVAAAAQPKEDPEDIKLLKEIRDLLKK